MIYLFLTLATLATFWQVNNSYFITYDDPVYVAENDQVRNGITRDGIRWAFTTNQAANWHPVTWISHMLDMQLFGLKPRWHHFTSLLFHVANTLLLFFVLYRMTKARWESAFVAALFALHPLHVESVAWVSERKDVLSTFFWIITMGAYCYYTEHPKFRRYLIVVVFFVLGLMSKPMLVTLPFVLLLLDYWPLQRFLQKEPYQTALHTPASGDEQMGESRHMHTAYQWASIRPLIWEKVPLFALAVLSSIVTYSVQHKGGAVQPFEALPMGTRISNASISYIDYIGKTIWPNNLAVFYPYPSLQAWQVIGSVLLLAAITLTAVRKVNRIPYLAVGWLWYAGTLVPVIGLVQVGLQARADRYTYVPLIGLFIIAAWGISELSRNWRYRKSALIALSSVVLVCLCMVTFTQVKYWRNGITVFDHALKVTDNNYVAYFNRGDAYTRIGKYQQAIGDFDKAIELNPKNPDAVINRGRAYATLGNYQQAIGDFDKAVELNPKNEVIYNNRGGVYSALGKYQQAIKDYDRAIEIEPKYANAYYNRGTAFLQLGNYSRAINDYDRALEINPKDGDVYNNRATALWRQGKIGQAIEDQIRAAKLGNKDAQNFLKTQNLKW